MTLGEQSDEKDTERDDRVVCIGGAIGVRQLRAGRAVQSESKRPAPRDK